MAERNYLKDLKRIAKDMARGRQIPLNQSQNEIAEAVGFPHWVALISKVKSGHAFTDADIKLAETKAASEDLYPHEGSVGGHAYHLCESFGDVILHGRGWQIVVFEAPSRSPNISVTDRRIARNPINDPSFVEAALRIARWKADQVRAKIARDWPRRSTKPAANGFATHPLSKERSDVWYCLHCEAPTWGKDIAPNFWHCPSCGASPINIFATPFWSPDPDDEMNG